MKNIFTLSILLVLSLSSFAKTYYIYTANKSGNWDNAGNWNVIVRNDNVNKDKFIIPAGLKIMADENVNAMGYTDVELQISGTLELASSTSLYFGSNTKIELLATGVIEGNGASQQIFIGVVSKYTGNKNKTLNGPLYADYSTGVAPLGFSSYSLLALVTPSTSISTRNENVTPSVYASNKNVHININTTLQSSFTVQIINMNGVVVASQSFNRSTSKVVLNMSHLKTGIYVVALNGNNNLSTVKQIAIN